MIRKKKIISAIIFLSAFCFILAGFFMTSDDNATTKKTLQKDSIDTKKENSSLEDYSVDNFLFKNLRLEENENGTDIVVDIVNNSTNNYDMVFFEIQFIKEKDVINEYIALGSFMSQSTTTTTLVSKYSLENIKEYKVVKITQEDFEKKSKSNNQ